MLARALVPGGGDGKDPNVKAVLLGTAAGVAASGVVIVAAGGWCRLSPATALAIAVVIGWHALKTGRQRPSLSGS